MLIGLLYFNVYIVEHALYNLFRFSLMVIMIHQICRTTCCLTIPLLRRKVTGVDSIAVFFLGFLIT